MRTLILVGVAAAVSACASTEELRMRAMNTPAPELCYYAIAGSSSVRSAAYYAISARSVDCGQHMAHVQARLSLEQQRANAGMMLLQAAQPKPAAPSRTWVHCRTVYYGNVAQTVCD